MIALLSACGSEEKATSTITPALPKADRNPNIDPELMLDRSVDRPPQKQGLSRTEETNAIIAEYSERLKEAEGDEAAALWFSMGNLHRQKFGDYSAAVSCYESILADYPDWSRISEAYVQAATCYEQLNETKYVRDTYLKMQRRFGPDSEEYKFAALKLKGEL